MKTSLLFGILLAFSAQLFSSNTRYRIMFREDPSTSMVIGWDQTSGSNPVVHYDVVDHGTNTSAYAFSKTVDRSSSYKGMTNTFARLTGLTPNTAYFFVIEDSQGISQRFWFKTCPNSANERLSFVAGGDSRNNATPRRNANKLVAKLRPHAVFFGGDMTNGDSNSEWLEWMDDWQLTIGSDGRMIPIVAARGNHEGSNNSIYNLFDVPSTDVYYALTFGGNLIRSYTLNSEISISGNQTTWLTSDLAANPNVVWKMAQYHKPMRPHVSSKSEGNSQYSSWATPFYNNNVKLVIECDAHTVKTTWPVVPTTGSGNDEGFIRDDANGTVYAGEGCWGAPLRSNNDSKSWTRASGQFNQFKWIFVDNNKIEMRTIKVDNADQVGTVNDSDIFTAPSNLDVWNPSSGSVVTIQGTGGNISPTVNITSPSEGAYFESAQTVNVSANASDADGNISKVEFLVDGVLQVTDNNAPYSVNLSLSEGTQAITAKAYDNEGASTTDQVSVSAGAFSQSIDVRISSSMDDVEEEADGTMYTTSSDLELVADGTRGNQVIGLRFTNIGIPQGAAIDAAYVQFTCDETNTNTTSVRIKGHDIDNAPAFSTSANDVSNRTRTNTSSLWEPNAWNSVGAATGNERTPELKFIIQEIVDRSGWSVGNALALIIEGTGERTAEAYDGTSSSAPLLHIEYTVGGGSTPNEAPIVNLTSPSNGNVFDEGTSINLTANASDSDGSVNAVEFFVNGLSLGTDLSSPYSVNYAVGVGSFIITAQVIDDEGVITTSTSVAITGEENQTGGNIVEIDFNDFEIGWGIWNDGGSDARRSSNDAAYSNGNYSIRLRDNTTTSVMTTDNLDLSNYESLNVSFSYYAASMDNSNEDFWLQISTDGGSTFTTVEEWNRDDEFVNNQRYNDNVVVNGPFTSNTQLRFRCDASGNSDWVYIDDVKIEGTQNGGSTPPANVAPTVSVTSPLQGSIFDEGTNITIAASANDSDGTVSSVAFYVNGTLVGTDNLAPYSVSWTIGEGAYSLIAIAIDDDNESTTSSIVSITGEATVNPPLITTFEKRIATGDDDAEEGESGAMYLNSSDLEFVYDAYNSQGNQEVGLRFTGVTIPSGATITNAYVTFTTDEVTTDACNLVVYGQDSDNAAQFTTSSSDISSRAKTSSSVNWTPSGWSVVGGTQNSPNLTSIVQEIVDRGGWSSGNSLAIVITGSGKRTAESYNGSSSAAPLLHVEYESSQSFRIGDNTINSEVQVYPNPANDHFTIENGEFEVVFVNLFDKTGELILERSMETGGVSEIDVTDLEQGIYYLSIESSNGVRTQKLIIE